MRDARVVAIVQARNGSSRLPGKALRPLAGKALILHVLERAAAMGYPTWLATTDLAADEPLVELCVREGYPVYRGDRDDVLGRMLLTAHAAQADVIVRVTGDCPLFAPDVGRRVVEAYLAGADPEYRIVSNDTTRSGYPDGLDVEVFSLALASLAHVQAADQNDLNRRAHDLEHVTPWMRRERPHDVVAYDGEDWRRTKVSVDDGDDFERVRRVFGELRSQDFSWDASRAAYGRAFPPPAETVSVQARERASVQRRRR